VEEVTVTEPDQSRWATLETDGIQCTADYAKALEEQRTIVFICSPTKEHIHQALLAAKIGAHLFIEKPLSHSMEGVEELKKATEGRTVMVGCNMRFHPGPKQVKELLEQNTIGTVTHATIHAASYLPNWRPGSDYTKSYSADPEQGGAILDFIHEIDLALWYLGDATLTNANVQPATAIGLSVDGEATLELAHENGAHSTVSMSFVKQGYERGCSIQGTEGALRWEYGKDVELLGSNGALRESFPEPKGWEPNQMYLDEIASFLQCIENGTAPFSSLQEAEAALTIALAARAHR
jgi:predicted dehydrogenase